MRLLTSSRLGSVFLGACKGQEVFSFRLFRQFVQRKRLIFLKTLPYCGKMKKALHGRKYQAKGMKIMKVAPSVLSADFTDLQKDICRVVSGGADWLHLDIMDGVFVPNLSFGFPVVEALRPLTEVPFDVHLMITHPKQYVKRFCEAGADIISFHLESADDTAETIAEIRAAGARPAVAIKPGTPAEAVFPYLDQLYMVLVMTVEPGFGGQKFMPAMMEKVKIIKQKAPQILVEVDGGIHSGTAPACAEAGVDICVAGTGVFLAEDPAAAIAALKNAG